MKELQQRWAKRLAKRRTEMAFSQRELGKRAGVTQSTINKIEKGLTSPSDEKRIRIARVLNVEVADLFPYPKTTKGE